MTIDRQQPVPLYFQLKMLLTEEILGGKYGPGDRLPTEHELCAHFQISRTPVAKALTELADEGVVLRHRRRGTFVNPHWLGRQGQPELRVIVPEGPWADQIRKAAPDTMTLSLVEVALPELHRTVTHAVGEGRAPDLAVLDSVWVREFAAAAFLLAVEDLDPDWIEDVYVTDFLEPFLTANRHEGRTYAIQAEADVAGMWIRRSAVSAVGHDLPATWGDVAAVANALMASGLAPPIALPGGRRAGETTTYCLLALLAANGAHVLRDTTVTLNDPASVETLTFLRSLVESGAVEPEAASYEWDQPIRMLAEGRVAIAFGGSYDAQVLADAGGVPLARVLEEFAFLPMPAGPRNRPATLAGGMVFAVFRQAAVPGLAMQLLRRLTTPEALASAAMATAQIPPRSAAVDLVAGRLPLIAETAAMLPNAVHRPQLATYPQVAIQLQSMLEAVLIDLRSPADAVARTTEMIAAITGWPSNHDPLP